MWINIPAAWLCLFIPCWCCFWSLLDENEILDALGLLLGQIQWDENAFQETPLKSVFVLISRHTQGSNSLESGRIAIEERHTENTLKVCPSNPPKQCHLEASSFEGNSLAVQVPFFKGFLNIKWSLGTDRSPRLAPSNTFYSLDPQPLSFCPSVHQSVPSVLSLAYSKPHFSGCFSGLLMALQAGPQLKGAQGLYPALGVTLLTLLWGSFFSQVRVPTSPAGRCPWLGRWCEHQVTFPYSTLLIAQAQAK